MSDLSYSPAEVDWREICSRMTREAFVEAHPHPFLLVLDGGDDEEQDFATIIMVATRDATPGSRIGEPGSIIPLVKSDNNPYTGRIIVGRARNCDVVLRDPSVSKFHADFRGLEGDGSSVTDRSSRNGTAVNGTDLVGGKPVPIKNGDRVRFGGVTTIFLDPGALHDAVS